MKNLRQIKITKQNEKIIAKTIQKLYKELWQNNRIDQITKRFKKYQNPHITLIESNNQLIGFGIYFIEKVENKKILFRGGAVIDKEYRGIGLYSRMVLSAGFHTSAIQIICVRTRDIGVYYGLYAICRKLNHATIYPNIYESKPKEIPKDIQKIMQYFSGAETRIKFPIVPNVYKMRSDIRLKTYIPFTNVDAVMIVIKKNEN